MKLGGLTWWRNNYGSILQAYALQETLNSIENVEYEIINQFGAKIISSDNLLDKLKTIGFSSTLKRAFWKFGVPKLRQRSIRMQEFVDRNLFVSKEQYSQDTISDANSIYDGFVCGSDQIWNPSLTDVNSMYWLGFVEEGKPRIAYAPSIGVDTIAAETAYVIRTNLQKFDAISCREESGTKLINSILGNDLCETVLDPTLMANRKIWDRFTGSDQIGTDYVFAYMLRGTKNQRKLIEEFAHVHNLKVVTIPFLETEYTEWYDFSFGDIKCWDADPADFINLIKRARFVFTDSFHSMVFSCFYHVPFFSFPKIGKNQMARIRGLQEQLGINGRIIDETFTVTDLNMIESIEWKKVDARLEEKQAASQKYLYDAIENIMKPRGN